MYATNLRASLSLRRCCGTLPARCAQSDVYLSRVFLRAKSVDSAASKVERLGASQNAPRSAKPVLGTPMGIAQPRPQPALSNARGRPQSVVIYHAGTGRIVFIGMMRFTTILLFAVSLAVVAPAFYNSEEAPWYMTSAIVVGSAIPMFFVCWTAAPFVTQVFLQLPGFAQASNEAMHSYLKNVPRTATLSIETMMFNFYPCRTKVTVAQLVPASSKTRPVTFMNAVPQETSWWKGKEAIYFYAPEKSRPAKRTVKFFPEVWEQVFAHIKNNKLKRV
ncbi:hypothetical protein VTO42DRAFT_4939 [Malbranchea cinnamomea]